MSGLEVSKKNFGKEILEGTANGRRELDWKRNKMFLVEKFKQKKKKKKISFPLFIIKNIKQ